MDEKEWDQQKNAAYDVLVSAIGTAQVICQDLNLRKSVFVQSLIEIAMFNYIKAGRIVKASIKGIEKDVMKVLDQEMSRVNENLEEIIKNEIQD